jgi:UDP-2,3-diacylglucosamine pyrophosphatase LpxH
MTADPIRARSIFISDVHLGYRGANAEALLEFLEAAETEQLFLVGDIVDLESLNRHYFWPRTHGAIVAAILRKAREGTRVILVPGNHDAPLREFDGCIFGKIEIHRSFPHLTADGRRMLVLHGDELDGAIDCHPLLARVGDAIYGCLLRANRWINRIRARHGLPYWSFATSLKLSIAHAHRYIAGFERAAVELARRRSMDGIICGHIHRPALRDCEGIRYCNTGDWVESCTCVAEGFDGALRLIAWPAHRHGNDIAGSHSRHIDGAVWPPGQVTEESP